jgi:hypothetical protein
LSTRYLPLQGGAAGPQEARHPDRRQRPFIAAHAGSAGPTLDTNNTTEFERVKGLKIENWTIQSRRRGLLNFYERAA